jgi:hypothetical protein
VSTDPRDVRQIRVERHAATFQKLDTICGPVQDSSEQIVTISQDDATRNYVVSVKGYGIGSDKTKRVYYGSSLMETIEAAYNGELQANDPR